VRKHSANPADDLARLFRHAIFNGLVGNTEDHLKNFAMLHDPGGYRLSPAYDLLPDVSANQEHVLFFGNQRYIESRITVVDMARRWGVPDAVGILANVRAGLSRFKEFAELAGVREVNIVEIEKDLRRRASRVGV
jgi:serine/threonine-protein kinase HipA